MTQESALHIMKTGENIFLTGAPGTGKTYVLNQYLDYLKDHGVSVAVTAPTGIAASHIGGMTLHSFFGIGIRESLSQYDIENLSEKKYLWERMQKLKVLVIDEVSMVSPQLFNSIDTLLKTFKFSTETFGGVQVILVGDFFQLPPINKNNSEARFIFQTESWRNLNLQSCYLQKSYRHSDETLLHILDEIRSNTISEVSMNHFRKRYKKKAKNITGSAMTRLYTHNIDVDKINSKELAAIDHPPHIYEAQTKGAQRWIERIFKSTLALPRLELKLGALVFFIKNNYEKNYINGTLGTIVDFDVFDIPIVETYDGERIKAERMEWNHTDKDGKIIASIQQIPLRLAWAITIHKSQGMTLDAAVIDLSKSFEPGQGYVALSRIKSLDGLTLMGLNDIALQTDPFVREVDETMKNHSDEIYQHFNELSEQEKREKCAHYMQYLGGNKEKGKQKTKESTTKIKSFLQSKVFFEQKKPLADIAKERGLSENTIMKHLQEIMNDDPEFDISYLQPKHAIISSVASALEKIAQNNNPNDKTESGDIKLKSIFTELQETVSYEDIKLALLFL